MSEEEKTPKEVYTKQDVEMDSENIQIEEEKIVARIDRIRTLYLHVNDF